MQYRGNEPIYLQIMDDFKKKIVSGEYKSGDKILPVRECAIAYEVNPNTMQKALSMLEQEDLVYTKRTAGRFITEDEVRIQSLKKELVQKQVQQMITNIRAYGMSDEAILQFVKGELAYESNQSKSTN